MMIRGLYRIPAGGDRPGDVRVDNGGIEHSIEETIYTARGYQPPLAELPSQDEYFAAKASPPDTGSPARASQEKAERERDRQEFRRRFDK